MHARYAPNIRYPKVAGFYHQLEERTSHGGGQRISGNFNSCCSGFSQILKLAGPPHSLLPTGLNVHDRDSLGFAWRRHLPDPLPFDTMPVPVLNPSVHHSHTDRDHRVGSPPPRSLVLLPFGTRKAPSQNLWAYLDPYNTNCRYLSAPPRCLDPLPFGTKSAPQHHLPESRYLRRPHKLHLNHSLL